MIKLRAFEQQNDGRQLCPRKTTLGGKWKGGGRGRTGGRNTSQRAWQLSGAWHTTAVHSLSVEKIGIHCWCPDGEGQSVLGAQGRATLSSVESVKSP